LNIVVYQFGSNYFPFNTAKMAVLRVFHIKQKKMWEIVLFLVYMKIYL